MPYCTECGAEVGEDSGFCTECGAEVQSEGSGRIEDETTDSQVPDSGKSGLRHGLPGISTKNTTRRNVLVGTGYLILGLGVLGAVADPEDEGSGGGDSGESGGGDSGTPTATEEQYPNAWAYDEDTGIVLRDVEGSVGQFSSEITGEATNESENDYSYVQLSFALYDSTDAKVGDALANTSGLDAGQRWRFEAIGTDTENVESFGLEDITAY